MNSNINTFIYIVTGILILRFIMVLDILFIKTIKKTNLNFYPF